MSNFIEMKVIGALTLFLSISAVISCEHGTYNPESEKITSNIITSTLDADGIKNPLSTTLNSTGLNPAHGKPGHRCDIPVGQPLSMSKSSFKVPVILPDLSTTINNGLNPAHGQPGHRCDIAVGKPLNSKPATSAIAQTTANSVQTTNTTASTNTTNTVAPGLNPAHGQPGHRCDIAVGQPLNSKPPKTNVAQTTSNAVPGVNTISATNAKPVAPGMNPAHGQPGHRCDIPVGKPLNSQPSTPAKSIVPWIAPTTVTNDSSKKS